MRCAMFARRAQTPRLTHVPSWWLDSTMSCCCMVASLRQSFLRAASSRPLRAFGHGAPVYSRGILIVPVSPLARTSAAFPSTHVVHFVIFGERAPVSSTSARNERTRLTA